MVGGIFFFFFFFCSLLGAGCQEEVSGPMSEARVQRTEKG